MSTIHPSARQGDELRKAPLSSPWKPSGGKDVSFSVYWASAESDMSTTVTELYQSWQEIEEHEDASQPESALHFRNARSAAQPPVSAARLRYPALVSVTVSYVRPAVNRSIQLPETHGIVFKKDEPSSNVRVSFHVSSKCSPPVPLGISPALTEVMTTRFEPLEELIHGESETVRSGIGTRVSHQQLPVDRTDLQTIARIRELAVYEDGWNGFDGKGPSPRTVQDAEAFIRRLAYTEIAPPHVSLAADGEINFLWLLPSVRLDLGFYGDGTYSYYGRTPTGDEFFADDVSIDTPLPQPLLVLLTHG
jgi:hypothetical protein